MYTYVWLVPLQRGRKLKLLDIQFMPGENVVFCNAIFFNRFSEIDLANRIDFLN